MGIVRYDPWQTLLTRIHCLSIPAAVIYSVTLSNNVPTMVNRVPCQQDMRNGMLKWITKDGLCCLCGKNQRCKRWRRGMDISRRCWENVSYVETLLIQTDPNIQVIFSLLFKCLFCILIHTETHKSLGHSSWPSSCIVCLCDCVRLIRCVQRPSIFPLFCSLSMAFV